MNKVSNVNETNSLPLIKAVPLKSQVKEKKLKIQKSKVQSYQCFLSNWYYGRDFGNKNKFLNF